MNCLKRMQKFFSSVVAVTFFVTNTLIPIPVVYAMPAGRQAANAEFPAFIPGFQIPAEFGKVTDVIRSPISDTRLLIHIQEAHANYDAQTNIRNILEHLSKNYGVKLILLEGAGNKLHPELFNFFPKDKELNGAITDSLMKAGQLTGAEVFMINNLGERETGNVERKNAVERGTNNAIVRRSPRSVRRTESVTAFGVENAGAYAENREAYRNVYEDRKLTESFLDAFYRQWQKSADQALNKPLREFLDNETAFEEERLPLQDWMGFLKTAAARDLKLDLDNVREQRDWPVLVRYFRLRSLDGKIDLAKTEKEKQEFFNMLKGTGNGEQATKSFSDKRSSQDVPRGGLSGHVFETLKKEM